jgi:hypothetical protein
MKSKLPKQKTLEKGVRPEKGSLGAKPKKPSSGQLKKFK